MKQKITYGQLKAIEEPLIKISKFELPAKLTKRMHDNINSLIPLYDKYNSEIKKTASKYGKLIESNNNEIKFDIDDDKMEDYLKELQKIMNKQIEINVDVIDFNEIEPYLNDNNRMSVEDFRILQPIIK